MSEPDDPTRRLIGDAAAAFETGVQFLTELQKRFLAGEVTEPLESILGRVGVFAERGRAATSQAADRAAQAAQAAKAHAASAPAAAQPGSLVVENLGPEVLERFRVAAGARAMEPAEYLTALVDLHEAMRRLVDQGGNEDVDGVLRRLRLSTVTA